MERDANPAGIERFRSRSRDNLFDTIKSLKVLRNTLKYDLNTVDLRIRLYNQLPVLRGVYANGYALLYGSYLRALTQPGRVLPHYYIREQATDNLGTTLIESWTSWFDYLWTRRSRIEAIECVIIDLYSTLIEVDGAASHEVRKEMAKTIGVTTTALKSAWLKTQAESNRGIYRTTEERFRAVLELVGKRESDDQLTQLAHMEHELLRTSANVFPETLSVLSDLARCGYKLALLSNCSPSVSYAINDKKLLPYFDVVKLSYEHGFLKPETEAYEAVLNELSVKPERCIFIGDGMNNELEGAASVGMKTVRIARDSKETKRDVPYSVRELTGLFEVLDEIETDGTRA
jgi:putative hydrolase of the HAD superfamily